MTRIRQSIPTTDCQQYWDCGWSYVMPDFDKPNHSIVEWLSEKMPMYPTAFPKQSTESAHDRTDHRRQQPT